MTTKAKTPAATGAPDQPIANSIAGEGTSSGGMHWIFSPVRVAAFEAEQRALAGFEQIADAMPDVAEKLTTELIPDSNPDVIRTRRTR